VDEIEKCSKINVKYGDLDCLHFWCPFLKNEPTDLLKKVWQVNQKKTLFNKILFSDEVFGLRDHRNILDFVTNCLGDNWHEILNNSSEKLNIADDDENEEDSKNINLDLEFQKEKRFFKNLYKLLILVEKTFDPKEKKMFEIRIILFVHKNFVKLHGNHFEKCIEKILKNYDVLLINIIVSIIGGLVDCKKLIYMQEILENFFKNDREKIREILFDQNVIQRFLKKLKHNSSVEFPIIFKNFFNVYDKYKNSWEEVQLLFFSGHRLYFTSGSIFEFLKQMPTEFVPEFLGYMKQIFGSNNESFLEHIKNRRHDFTTGQLLIFEDFLTKYFDGNEDFVRKGMRSVLYSDNKNYLYYSADNIAQYINLRRKYQNSIEEFQEYLKSWRVLSKFFLFMPNESYPHFMEIVKEIFSSNKKDLIGCIQDINWKSSIISPKDDKFYLLEQFFKNFFNDNEEDAKTCLRKIILSVGNISIILINQLNDKNEFERVKNIYRKYLTIEEIRSDFVSNNALLHSFNNYSLECHPKFIDFAKEIFKENNEQLFKLSSEKNSSRRYFCSNLIKSDMEFKYFEKFLTDFYENDECQVKNIIRIVLFNQGVIETQLFMKYFHSPKFQNFRKIYTKYKNSWEEIQNIFIFLQNLLEIFEDVDEETFPVLQEFLIEIFETNKFLLFSCFNYKKRELLIKRPEKLKFLEKFLQKFTDNDEILVKYCMQNILFGDNFNPLPIFVKNENLDKLEYLITIYKKYKISWETLQMFFTSKPLSNLFFRYMSDKTYPIIEEFIREIFDSNKPKLSEIELIHDIIDAEFEDYFYDEDNEKYIIEKFKLFCKSMGQNTRVKLAQSWQDAGRRTPKTPKRRTPSGVGRQFFFGRPTPMASDDGGVGRQYKF